MSNLLCVGKMNTVASKCNVKSEFMEIDSIGGWPQLYQVWNCVLSYGIERDLNQGRGSFLKRNEKIFVKYCTITHI